MSANERWFILYRGAIYPKTETYETRQAALDAVLEHNQSSGGGFTCLRIPYRIRACEGCENILLDCIFDAGAQHLTEITWEDCWLHNSNENEQTSMIQSWVYGD